MLEDKVFLFVEDDIQSIHYFRRGLLSKGVKVKNVLVVESLHEAIDIIRDRKFDYIFIDLYCAPSSPELKPYEHFLGEPEFNHGQLLGLWLDEHYPDTPYGYITQIPTLVKNVNDKQSGKTLFNKNQLTSRDFVEKVMSIIEPSSGSEDTQ